MTVPKSPKKRLGATQQKILLILLTGIALGFTHSPRTYFKIVKAFKEDWRSISEHSIRRSTALLKQSGYVKYITQADGSRRVVLTRKGEERAWELDIGGLTIETPNVWDGKWRVVLFDIPTKKNRERDIFRFHLKRLNFTELQKSVFAHPFPCFDVIEEISLFYGINQYVILVESNYISNEQHLRKEFKI